MYNVKLTVLIIFKCTVQSCSVYAYCCTTCLQSFHLAKLKLCTHPLNSDSPFLPPPQSLAPTILLAASISLDNLLLNLTIHLPIWARLI